VKIVGYSNLSRTLVDGGFENGHGNGYSLFVKLVMQQRKQTNKNPKFNREVGRQTDGTLCFE